MSRIVIGGGLGGLSAAYYSLKLLPKESVTLLESSNRTGGWIKSSKQEDGTIFEQGPRTIRPTGEAGLNTLQLIEDLNLSDFIRPIPRSHPAALNRMIYVKGKLYSLPSSFQSLFKKQEPFSKPLVMCLLKDFMTKKKVTKHNDDSIYEFAKRRFGEEVADYLISPMICGICAGNAKEISVKFLMEKLFDYEQKYGSITRGIFKNALTINKATNNSKVKSELANRANEEKWSVYSFDGGMEMLPITLSKKVITMGANVELNSPVKNISIGEDVRIFLQNREIKAKHLISSIPAVKLGDLLENSHPTLSKILKDINSVTVGVVNLSYKGKLIDREGFGFLISPKENLPILGVIYDSCCFQNEINKDSTNLTVMMGGYWFEHYFGKEPSSDKLLSTAIEQLRHILNINSDPVKYKVNILRDCIPQYTVGHKSKIENIENYIKTNRLPLSLCGSSYYGVGVNDVILSAKKAVLGTN